MKFQRDGLMEEENKEEILLFDEPGSIHLHYDTPYFRDIAATAQVGNVNTLWRALDDGPYTFAFTPNGMYMVLAGPKGHLEILHMDSMSLIKEMQIRKTVRDIVFLNNECCFVSVHQRYPYVYDGDGTELQCLKEHGEVSGLQFLENQCLLASINNQGELHYQDMSTGAMTGNIHTGLGQTNVMKADTLNDAVALGHKRGTVSMWKPTSAGPQVKMLCHTAPVQALAFHPNGHLMATAGKEKKIKIWDLRKFKLLQIIPGSAKTLDFSQKGLLATGSGSDVEILGDFSESQPCSVYKGHPMVEGCRIDRVLFRPNDDVLGIGHSMGWSSIHITSQTPQVEVHNLLDAIQLNPMEQL